MARLIGSSPTNAPSGTRGAAIWVGPISWGDSPQIGSVALMDPGDDALRHELLQPHRGRPSRERIFAQLEAGVTELRSKMGGLPSPDEADGIWGDIWRQEAHNSTALEGNTLALREVVLLELGKAVGGKTLREYLEVRGVCRCRRVDVPTSTAAR